MGSWLVDIVILGIVYDVICYWLGIIFFKAITFGRFPNHSQSDTLKEQIKFVGALVLVAIIVLIAWLFFK